mgnify:CR=1 FL=1|jgi:hypothetical protein
MALPIDPGTLKTVAAIGTMLLSMFGGGGSKDKAAATQAALSNELIKMFKQRQNLELPYRKSVLQKTFDRSNKQFPKFTLPGRDKLPIFNPLGGQTVKTDGVGARRKAITPGQLISQLWSMKNGGGQ